SRCGYRRRHGVGREGALHRLVGVNRVDILVRSASQPSKDAARGMGKQDRGTDLVEQSRHPGDWDAIRGRGSVWCLLLAPLHESVGVPGELDARVVVRPDADAEANKDSLFASGGWAWHRADSGAVGSGPA